MKFNSKFFVFASVLLMAVTYFLGYESRIFGSAYFWTGVHYDKKLDLLILFTVIATITLIAHAVKNKSYNFILIPLVILMASAGGIGGFQNNTRPVINVLLFGARGDMQSFTDGAYTGTTTFTSATASFTSADVGKTIRINLAAGGGNDLITTIASVSNSTTVILANATSGTQSAQPFDYGADNTSKLQAAANSVPTTGGVLYFPLGYYLKNGLLNIPNPTLITGDMSGRFATYDSVITNTLKPRSKIVEISLNLPQSVTIQSGASRWENLDLAPSLGVQPTSGVGLNINADNVSIINSCIGGFWTGVSQNYSAYWRADHCAFSGYQYGLVIRNLRTADAGDWTVTDCQIGGFGTHPASSGILILSSGGGKISNNKWNVGLHKCISVEILPAGNTSDLLISHNSLENFDSCGINIVASGSAVFSNIVISGNQIAPYTAHATGINLNGTGATFFKAINVTGNVLFNQNAGDTAIKLTSVQDANISGNVINGNWTKNVYVDGTSTNIGFAAVNQVAVGTASNSFIGSANFTSNGTTTYVQNNLQVGNSTNTNGVVPRLTGVEGNTTGLADLTISPSTGTNSAASIALVPNGTGIAGIRTNFSMLGTDTRADPVNYTVGFIRMNGTQWTFVSTRNGTGALVPIVFTAGVAPSIEINTSTTVAGNVLLNNTTDNSTAFLQVTNAVQAQLALHYDASNNVIHTVSSTGNYTIAPSGGTTSITGNLNISGAISNNVTNISATGTYSATATDCTIQFTGSTATLVYPTVNLVNGRHLNLVNNASGSITIPSTKTGNASTSTTMTTGTRLQVEYDLTNTTWIQVNGWEDWAALMLTLGLIRPLFKRKSFHESVYNQAA